MLLPSDVHKQILCSLVDVEDFIPEQTEAGGALQSQLPQRQRRRVAVQHRMTQDETDWRENRVQSEAKINNISDWINGQAFLMNRP